MKNFIGAILLFSMLCFGQHVNANSIVNYKNGVYYFASTGETFAKELSAFIASNSDLELVAMTARSNDKLYSNISGHVVVFKKKNN